MLVRVLCIVLVNGIVWYSISCNVPIQTCRYMTMLLTPKSVSHYISLGLLL